jgi:4-amino-4-deoxy-L-arabinose transferase-like glycosyltransferase
VKKIKINFYTCTFIIILLVGLYLRFYHIEYIVGFGWDQARDAWKVRDLLLGGTVLEGPRTGVGHIHLGPAHYYLLAPFYFLTGLDPMASNYYNIVVNIFNFFIIYWITSKIFSKKTGLFAIFLYAVSNYIIKQNQIPWNVSLVPGISILIFYSLYELYKGKHKYALVVMGLTGFFLHLHFTAVFLPLIVIISLAFVPNKKNVLKWLVFGLPLFALWLIPSILFDLSNGNTDSIKLQNFIDDYYHGFHFRFLLHRLPDALILLKSIIYIKELGWLIYIIPGLCSAYALFKEKDQERRKLVWMMLPWIVGPLIGFTLYSGPISDYYFLITFPGALFLIIYFQDTLLKLNKKIVLPILICIWLAYTYFNTKDLWIKPNSGGLAQQKDEVRADMKIAKSYVYGEGDIKSYLYIIWSEETKKNKK